MTLPERTVERADHWARKQGKSRSRLVADLLDAALENLSEQEITRRYNEAYANSEALEDSQQLAEELHDLLPRGSEDDQW